MGYSCHCWFMLNTEIRQEWLGIVPNYSYTLHVYSCRCGKQNPIQGAQSACVTLSHGHKQSLRVGCGAWKQQVEVYDYRLTLRLCTVFRHCTCSCSLWFCPLVWSPLYLYIICWQMSLLCFTPRMDYLFWSNTKEHSIRRAHLNGSHIATIATNVSYPGRRDQ